MRLLDLELALKKINMFSKEEIFKMVSKIKRHSRGANERRLINPEREWAIGILVFLALLLIGFWYNAVTFSYYRNVEKHITEETVSIPNYNYGTLAKVLERYNERQRKFDEIKSGIVVQAQTEVIDENTASSTDNGEESEMEMVTIEGDEVDEMIVEDDSASVEASSTEASNLEI